MSGFNSRAEDDSSTRTDHDEGANSVGQLDPVTQSETFLLAVRRGESSEELEATLDSDDLAAQLDTDGA